MSRAQGRGGMRQDGFTLVELMIVVAIIAVLAVVAANAFRKYSDAGRTTEAMAMIGEFKAKEEAYRAEYNQYLATTTTGESDLYPVLTTGCSAGQVEPCPKTLPDKTAWTSVPLSNWLTLGINPTRSQLYCGYVAIAGQGSTGWSLAGSEGQAILGTTAPTGNWFYVRAQCDNNRSNALNTTFLSVYNSTTIVTKNEHQ